MFDESLQSLSSSLSSLADPTPHAEPLHPPLHALEKRTEEMASLLESLTQHYDRCSRALKDSEAATPVDPDLMAVLSRDAAEVDDVVHELKELLSEMEAISYGISSSIEELRLLERDTIAVFAAFEEFQSELGICMDGLREFEMLRADLKKDMENRLSELWELGEFYEGFVGAYDAMVVEVGRRKGVAVRMEAVVKEAQRKLCALYNGSSPPLIHILPSPPHTHYHANNHADELQDREIFTEEFGQWLPVDLWPGFRDPPVRWIIEKDLQSGSELPKLGKDVIDRALRRRAPVS